MLIVTNTAGFPATWESSSGEEGASCAAHSVREFLQAPRSSKTVWLVNCDPRLTYQLAAVSLLLPWRSKPLIVADLVLAPPPPAPGLAALSLFLKRKLLGQVTHFIHHFKDWTGYDAYGAGTGRSSFVEFKANLYGRYDKPPNPEGEYVLCFGRSRRDFDTFFAAMEQLPYPGAIMQPNLEHLEAHGSRFTRSLEQIPPNIRLLEDDGSEATQIRALESARLIALPTVKRHIAASGLSVSLNAMLLGKCVIGSEGPGMSDIFPGRVLIVPPEDPKALAEMIGRAWENDSLRGETALEGYRYVSSLGGAPQLFQRLIDRIVELPT